MLWVRKLVVIEGLPRRRCLVLFIRKIKSAICLGPQPYTKNILRGEKQTERKYQ